MSDEAARKEDQPQTAEGAEKAEERKLSVEDVEAEKAEDVRGGGFGFDFSVRATNVAGAGGSPTSN